MSLCRGICLLGECPGSGAESHQKRQQREAAPDVASRLPRRKNADAAARTRALVFPIEHGIRHAHPGADSGLPIHENLPMRMSPKSIG
jgi:hypothetical protein